jgi:hypothetical protein
VEPTRDSHATLVDLLDRVLDKGLVIEADLIVHVAGIPLLGLSLRAYLAGMETMLKYGIWQDWDEAQRAIATEEYRQKQKAFLSPGEEVLLETFASQWFADGIYSTWRPGHLYITNRKIVLFRKEPAQVLFQCPCEEIRGLSIDEKDSASGKEAGYLYLLLSSGDTFRLRTRDVFKVRDAIGEAIRSLHPELNNVRLPLKVDEMPIQFQHREKQSNKMCTELVKEEVEV